YVDAPLHRYTDGADVSELPLESLAELPGVVIDAGGGRAAGPDRLGDVDARGKAGLVRTGWDRHWGTGAYFEGHPVLAREAGERLACEGAALVGIDSYNIDDTADGERPAHSILLAAGIPICEHLCNLRALPVSGFRFTAVPVKIQGLGSFPVRAFAAVE